jgi:predicted MPP superfamily phosphohydrolase
MGNHEYIAGMMDGMGSIMQGLRESGVDLLVDESRRLEHGGAHLWLMGIDYPPQGGSHIIENRLTQRTTDEAIHEALKDVRDDGAPRILLSHHPRTFVQASEYPIDLTLSGHMHGGQLVAGRIGDYVLSPVLPFEHYHNGLYERNGRKLYVNAGAGGWMPVRINCPPEITLVELVPA